MNWQRRSTGNRSRRGFTLIEMMISITLMLIIFAAAVPFFQTQSRAVDEHSRRFDAVQTSRFAVAAIERELRIAGNAVSSTQPVIVQADSMSITFNVDLVSRTSPDLGAVYYRPDAPEEVTSVLPVERAITLPRSTRTYPAVTHRYGTDALSPPSYAETISFWLAPDTTTGRAGQWVLWRRANDAAPTVVANGLELTAGQRPFTYLVPNAQGQLVEVARTRLPLVHTAATHGSPADTGASRTTDSIRVVRVRLSASLLEPRRLPGRHTAEGYVRIANMAMARRNSCGVSPVLGVTLQAQAFQDPYQVRLRWDPATDEAGGWEDVERYALSKRRESDPSFDEPFLSVPAGSSTYEVFDSDPQPGRWVYGLSAQDCTPSNSTMSVITVTVPDPPDPS